MKTIILSKDSGLKLVGDSVYHWTYENSEPYNLVLDGISIDTGSGDINTKGGYIDTWGGGIYTKGGYIYTSGGGIYTKGGNIDTMGGGIYTRGGGIYTRGGGIYAKGGNIDTWGGNIDTGSGDINTKGGDIHTRGGGIYTSGGKITCGKLFWGVVNMPGVEINAEIVLPPASTRSHWQERLAEIVEINDTDCYDVIMIKLKPLFDEILALDKWSKCERWIIESWKKKAEEKQ